MKFIYSLGVCFLITLFFCGTSYSQNTSSSSQQHYFGHKPPSNVAELFPLDAAFEKGWQLSDEIGPNMDEFYMVSTHGAAHLPTVIVFAKENRVWKKHDFYATLSGGDDVLYSEKKYIERVGSGWSKMKSLGPMIDRDELGIMRLSASSNGTYVFDDAQRNSDVIRISHIKNGKREKPKRLAKHINTGKWTAHPFIAPDDSYLIWDSEREEGYGDSDIYISFRQKDGSWGAAINLGDKINTEHVENGAFVTSDGKYLFFGRSHEKFREDGSSYWAGGKHWIDAKIIDELRAKQ